MTESKLMEALESEDILKGWPDPIIDFALQVALVGS